MARTIVVVLISLMIAAGLVLGPPMASAGGETVNAVDVAHHMDKAKYSSADIKSYLKGLKGKEISAHGKVNEVLTGKSGIKVVLHINIPGKSSPFVVDVQTSESGHIHKGETVSCRGEFVRAGMLGIVLKGSCGK